MSSSVRFKACYRVEAVPPDRVFVLSATQRRLLQGKTYYLMAPFLVAGKHSADEIVEKLDGEYSPELLYAALEHLKAAGYLDEVEHALPSETVVFCELLGVDPELAAKRLRSTKIYVPDDELPLQTVSQAKEADIWVVLTDDYLLPRVKELCLSAQRQNAACLLVCPSKAWVGPCVTCWECLEHSLRRAQIEENYLEKTNQNPVMIPSGTLPSTRQFTKQWAATELFKWVVSGGNFPLKDTVFTFDALTTTISKHTVVRRTHCEHCGSAKKPSKSKAVQLCSRKKKSTDNEYRSISPETTFEKNAHHISPILGIVGSLQPITLNSSLHVCIAQHNFTLSSQEPIRSSSRGKGKTAVQAKVSCLCEALERYCGVFQGNEPVKKASYNELKDRAVHPHECLLFSKHQYENRENLNIQNPLLIHQVPLPFSENKPIDWTPVWSLTHRTDKYLPTAFCYYAYPSKEPFCFADSNGNAAGNCLEEAILYGALELIERDAVALWWYNRIHREAVDLASFQDPYFAQLAAEYKHRQRELWVLDITTDLEIPVFAAVSRKTGFATEDILLGFGAHLNPHTAITRALTELNQFVLPLEGTIPQEKCLAEWLQNATLQNQPYLKPKAAMKNLRNLETDDLLDDIQVCQQRFERAGLEMLVLDQSRPEVELSVAKVIVPGLRHFWPRFAPGRLYDVPVQMGWLKKPCKESELNPTPMFL